MTDEKEIELAKTKGLEGSFTEPPSERKKLVEEREKAAHNAKVDLAFTFVWIACLAAKLWWLK